MTNGDISWQRKLIRARKKRRKKPLIADWRDPTFNPGQGGLPRTGSGNQGNLHVGKSIPKQFGSMICCGSLQLGNLFKKRRRGKWTINKENKKNSPKKDTNYEWRIGFLLFELFRSFFGKTRKAVEVIDLERSRQMERRDKFLSGSSLHYVKLGGY